MQIQVNTDSNVQGDDSLAGWVRQEIEEKLERFSEHITRIEVHLSDVNAARESAADKRCLIEARLAGREPTAVSHEAGKVAEAVHGAMQKLVHALDRIVGRSREVRGRESIRGE
jgi:ribosome-associated translation inhibitor RaiA